MVPNEVSNHKLRRGGFPPILLERARKKAKVAFATHEATFALILFSACFRPFASEKIAAQRYFKWFSFCPVFAPSDS